jgi:uncharacterized protein
MKKKVVIDNNVLFASFLFDSGNCNKIMQMVTDGEIKNYISIEMLSEFEEKLKKKFEVDNNTVQELLTFTIFISQFINITVKIEKARDVKDNMVLETAVSADANYIITGDKDLLVLNEFKGIKIISPHDFLKKFKS